MLIIGIFDWMTDVTAMVKHQMSWPHHDSHQALCTIWTHGSTRAMRRCVTFTVVESSIIQIGKLNYILPLGVL